MSTFDGVVAEFPDIRIDYFRPSPSDKTPAIAYFLSHVHSDHLQGLETCKSPFIYCSAATRDILLRLEKYPHRMNFARGILEARKQTYRHLSKLLKAVALETPTVIELAPGREIRVTLIDANHCVGAVMFLIEGDGKAVLYTGDVRSELWWVNNLTRQPMLLPYVGEGNRLRTLDCIYLDTTFVVTGREDPYAEFPSKADGLRELLRKVAEYPKDTLFYLDAWTFGYEDVWTALSAFLRSLVHVDDYRYGLYRALANGMEPKASETSKLMGFAFANRVQNGCLSSNRNVCRIHSCERGTECDVWSTDFVPITPIVTRHNGKDYTEVGAGGGQYDLNLQHELEVHDASVVTQLMSLCVLKLSGQPQLLQSVIEMLSSMVETGTERIKLDCLNLFEQDEMEELSIERLVPALSKIVTQAKLEQKRKDSSEKLNPTARSERPDGLPRQIRFPYSRHSSYGELCHLIEAFKPKDIHPCTVDETHWNPSFSMAMLFGHLYDDVPKFRHDMIMLEKKGLKLTEVGDAPGHASRPTSKGESRNSAPSEYGTPISHHSLTYVNDILTAEAASRAFAVEDRPRGAGEANASTKRTRGARQLQGNFWPPIETDHYSPPTQKRRRSSSLTPPGDRMPATMKDRTASTKNRDAAKRGAKDIKRMPRTAFVDVPEEWQKESVNISNANRQRQSSNYGRLSPYTAPDRREIKDSDACSDRTPPSLAKWKVISASSGLSSPAESRLAFRQEVHEAILGRGERDWADIGLVSSSAYQRNETEL